MRLRVAELNNGEIIIQKYSFFKWRRDYDITDGSFDTVEEAIQAAREELDRRDSLRRTQVTKVHKIY